MANTSDHFVLICETCKTPLSAGDVRTRLGDALPEGFGIRMVDCMAGCDTPRTVGFTARNKAQYLFGPIETAEDVAALSRFAHQYRASDTGWTNATDRPRALFTKTLARLPRIDA